MKQLIMLMLTFIVTISPVLASTQIYSRISESLDDAEERISTGKMFLNSPDLEMVYGRSDQMVGMRFQNIEIPQAAIITNAYIEFESSEVNFATTNLEFFAQDTDNAPTFSKSSYDISNRVKTSTSVQWNNVPAWNNVSEKHSSPDISSVTQQIVDRSGWLSGNSIVILVTGSGERTAKAYNSESQNAPLLVVEYTTEPAVYQCSDGIDNDGDGLIDIADSGCASSSDTSEFGDNECDDGIDNDADGLIDIVDQGCASVSDTSEFGDNECDDGIDNDADGLIDIVDQGCLDLTGADETNCGDGICEAEESWQTCSLDCTVPQCSDGIDNDGDGLIDIADSGCASNSDISEFGDNECDDGLDNDADGLIDIADSGCASSSDTSEFGDNECDDGIDNDADGLIDIADSGCASSSDTSEFGDNECDDGIDNDADGLIDIADSGCASGSDTSEFGDNECDDGVDNDADGLIDIADSGCASNSDISEFGDNECDDGIDNDADGLIDIADQGCFDLTGADETNCGDGICEAEESWQTCSLDCTVPQCSDGIDNDGDGLIDIADSGCSSNSDISEFGDNECDDGIDNDADGLIDFPNDPGCLSEIDDDEINELPTTIISSIISQSSDDAEEKSGGSMSLNSPDLEMVYDRSNQVVGMRFQNIEVPQAAIITNAYIEFETDEVNSVITNLEFFAQDTDNAPTFLKSNYDISNRVKTSTSVQWSNVPVWNNVSEKHRSPDMSPVIQQIVDRSGWLSGNSIAIIVTGSGERTAKAYNSESQNAPLLVIEYKRTPECSDGINNDFDQLIDFPDDPGCTSPEDDDELGITECDDGINNDFDQLIDFPDDPGCTSPEDGDELGITECDDGEDNDGDGSTDHPNDPGCTSAVDGDELGQNECDDGEDNDSDALVDFPDDLGCTSAADEDEINCGNGICEAEESEETCSLDCSEPEFDLLNVTGNNEDLIEGTYTPSNSADLPNLATQYKRSIHQGGFGTDSVCGLRGEIIKVTNLNDSGLGSLRDAVSQDGPRTIIFEVSGAIKLKSQLEINSPFVTIAGQTAPPPGISLYHEALRVHTHDVCLQHMRVRLGDRDHNLNLISAKDAKVADTMVIRGGRDPDGTYNVVLDNMSVSWSIDETISIFSGVSNLTIRDSIIAEPLRSSLHEGDHAHCLFIQDSERVSVIGNLFGHCQRRSPRMDGGTLQYVNNFVYNPGEYAAHMHEFPIHVTMVGNIMDFPDDPTARYEGGAEEFFASRSPEAKVYFLGNKSFEDRPLHQAREEGLPVVVQSVPRVWEGNVMALTAAEIEGAISDWVGAFPKYRDVVDARIIEGVRTHTGTYLDSQMENGGYVYVEENHRLLTPPENPQNDDDDDGISNLVEWLQSYTDAIE